jgi:hypothetical protein
VSCGKANFAVNAATRLARARIFEREAHLLASPFQLQRGPARALFLLMPALPQGSTGSRSRMFFLLFFCFASSADYCLRGKRLRIYSCRY